MALRTIPTIAALCFISAVAQATYSEGNHTVTTFDPSGVPDGVTMKVWTPMEPGKYPVMALASAFGMNFPISLYDKLFSRVASHGVIVTGISKINNPNYPLLAHEFAHSLEWMHTNLSDAIAANGVEAVQADVTRLVAAGHSAGNHIMVQMLQDGCQGVQAVVMLDPVDGVDPYGLKKEYAIHPPAKVNFTVPALHIETGNDPVPVVNLGKLWPPCAPPLLSNSRFYDAWRGPIWQVNATAFGHLDVCDPGIARTLAAPICKEEFGQDSAPYRDMVADLIAAFMDGVLNGAAASIAMLESAEQMPVDVILQHDYHGLPVLPGCTHL